MRALRSLPEPMAVWTRPSNTGQDEPIAPRRYAYVPGEFQRRAEALGIVEPSLPVTRKRDMRRPGWGAAGPPIGPRARRYPATARRCVVNNIRNRSCRVVLRRNPQRRLVARPGVLFEAEPPWSGGSASAVFLRADAATTSTQIGESRTADVTSPLGPECALSARAGPPRRAPLRASAGQPAHGC